MSDPIDACGSRAAMPSTSAAVVVERVRPAHRGEHAIARVLQRQMEVRQEPAAARDEIDDRRRAVHRFERADAERDVAGHRVERAQQVSERRRGRQVAAVRAEVDAGDGDFLEPGGGDACDLADEIRDRQAPRRAARGRNDAIGAALLAAGLRADRERRPTGDAGFDRRAARTVTVVGSDRRGRACRSAHGFSTRRSSLSSLRMTRTTGSAATSSSQRVA